MKFELFNDHFENAKRYNIPRAQLIIADIPYNLGNNAYASDPRWYKDGDNTNGESKLCTERLSVPFGHDEVTNPKHYQGSQGLEVIEAHKDFLAEELLRSYHKGSILKYLLHEREKNGLEDLKKARKHLDWLIELEEE